MQKYLDREDMLRRFLNYVKIETTSIDEKENIPSSACQWDLARLLKRELEELGLSDVRLDDHCYVYARLPERLPAGSARAGCIPAIGFMAHMDVSSAVPGRDVKAVIHEKYDGKPITLPGSPDLVLSPHTDAPLGDYKGLDIITSDGTTLLGADDKSGIAIIMSMLKALRDHEEIPHGPIRIAFTPDEEVGRGVDKFDLQGFGAEVAYTVDGEGLGEVEDETFCADAMDVTFHGINVHPGYAKNKMINSIKLASDLIARLPRDGLSPETTDGREPYVHPRLVSGEEEKTLVKFLIRDFDYDGLARLEKIVEDEARAVVASHPGARLEVKITHSYKNMKMMLDKRPEASGFAEEAVKAAGLAVVKKPIRGGTDGSRLSYMGLPTPNIFTGGHNFHGRKEWIVVQHMEKSAEVCLRLVSLWCEKGEKKGLLQPVE